MTIDTPPATPPIVVITGPTATGKTAAAIRLADHLPIEVINGDSRLFYRGMDIGTAKPSPEERAAVPHHLVDTLDAAGTTSLAEFQDTVYTLIREVHARHALPVLVGGTQQYVNAVVEGWRIPRVPPHPEIRARFQREAERCGAERLLDRLRDLDPAAANSTGPNLRRVIRALEVIEVTGKPISEQQGKTGVWFAPLLIGLTMPRDALYGRIDRRVDEMLDRGLVDELRVILDSGVPSDAPALSSIGYRQLMPYLRDEQSLEEATQRIKHDTHRLVRQQQTWLRKSTGLMAIDVSGDSWFDTLLQLVMDHLTQHPIP
jgi:tRNA dimethylallyltransferase